MTILASPPRVRRPLLLFVVTVIAVTWAVQLAFLAVGLPLFPALLIELVVLVGTAAVLTRRADGRAGVRRLFAGVLRWRFGVRWYVLALVALPVLTLGVAVLAGTFRAPDGWAGELVQYLFVAVVFGALLGNVWEELAWTGYLQSRLADRHGWLLGALLTAVPFGLIHLPMAFEEHGLTGTGVGEVAIAWGALVAVAPFFRVLLGVAYERTGRSVLAVGLLHGSFNASGATAVAGGGWEYLVAAGVLAIAVAGWAVADRRRVRT
ncbi:CPBP family intramembrane glutamic endopeptidase [Cryptosporangium minutisporangium]|uniref:CPBP family intramembrane glutamic endopeptidase n=1 Tax=Cryptosporangium minutisporangium TaxID=113569 RepID=UPI0035EABD10